MRVAILGCIHGNLPALEAVLADADAMGADRIVCAGDVVGWGPQPREALALLRSRGVPSIRGHDDRRAVDLALDDAEGRNGARPARAVRWTLDRLDGEDVRTLAAFPLSYGFTAAGRTIVVVHGTPRAEDEALGPDATPRKLGALLLLAGADVLACAHGHRAFVRELEEGRLVVNVGSVGRPFDGDVRAAYALLDVKPGSPPRAEVRRVEYDLSAVVTAARAARVPRRTLSELAARARAAGRGAAARGLALTAPFRGAPTMAALARETLRRESKRLARAGREEQDRATATHDARVATRRLESALSVFEGLLPEAPGVERELRAILRDLSAARDLDVAHQLLAASATTDGAASVALDAALEALERDRVRAERARSRALARAARGKLRRRIRALARDAQARAAGSVAARIAEAAASARAALDQALAPGSTDDSVHAFRVAVKKLRYAIEPFARQDPAAAALERALSETQETLGDARDRAQVAQRLDNYAGDLRASGRVSLAAAVVLLAEAFRGEAIAEILAFKRSGPSAVARLALDLGREGDLEPPSSS
jgi:CHAD domain-containing protein/predicted phosphodiesterase